MITVYNPARMVKPKGPFNIYINDDCNPKRLFASADTLEEAKAVADITVQEVGPVEDWEPEYEFLGPKTARFEVYKGNPAKEKIEPLYRSGFFYTLEAFLDY